MTKFKRLMALAAVSMLGIQMLGVGTAFAAESECDFGSDSLDITLGLDEGPDSGDAYLWIESDGMLYCQDDVDTYSQAASSIDTITVAMDDDDSDGQLTVYLDDENDDAAEWPDFKSFDIDVTTVLVVNGADVTDAAANRLNVKFGSNTFSFSGTSGSYDAAGLEIYGGDDKDTIDASKATVKVWAYGGDEDDTIKGGSGNDVLDGEGCDDGNVLYGNGGNDTVESTCGEGQAWGGDGHDYVEADTVAPGTGNDDVCGYTAVVYADITGGIEWDEGTISGAAGDDDIQGGCGAYVAVLGAGDDVFADYEWVVKGGAGDDLIKTTYDAYGGTGNDFLAAYDDGGEDNEFYGNAGNDVLRGKSGDDVLRGGPGSDQAWGATGEDTCNAEVENRCELAFA